MSLPACQWRRQPVAPERHICISPRVRCNASGIADADCFTCRHRDHPRDAPRRRECRHFGPFLDALPLLIRGRLDGARVVAAVHTCAVHGRCSPNTAHTDLACCLDCVDHEDDWHRDEAGDVRHLTYFVYPAGPWLWNVEQLLRRIDLFNGRRLVAVALDEAAAPLEAVQLAFDGVGVEFLTFRNDPRQKELVAFVPLMEAVSEYRGRGDVTFYGHAKGAGSLAQFGEGVRRWAASMYAGCLDYWPAVRRQLADHAAVGAWRRVMSPVTVGRSSWHYSGTFRWVRNLDLYRRNWRGIDPDFYGPETHVGRQFRYDEAACLFGDFAYAGVGLYLEATWDQWAQAALDQFAAAHVDERT